MIKIKAGQRKVVASALTFCFFLQQSFCLQVLATQISGVTGVNGVYNIDPTAVNGDIGFRKYDNFDLSKGDVANLIFNNLTNGKDINTFINLVDNQINIQGIVNSVTKDGAFNPGGHAVFVSPNGMVVGSSGVLNVGSLSVLTPESNTYEAYKSNLRDASKAPSLLQNYKEELAAHGNGVVKIDGNVLARNFVDINAADVNIANNALVMAGVKDSTKLTSNEQANILFNRLVNTDNLNPANSFRNDNGSIKIESYGANGGTVIAGNMKNFGKGNVEITNTGAKGIDISGRTANSSGETLLVNKNGDVNVSGVVLNRGGKLVVDNTGSGVLIASTGLMDNNDDELIITNTGVKGVNIENGGSVLNATDSVNINNTGLNGINVKGLVSAHDININNKNSNVVIGDKTGKNYLTSSGNVNIDINNGNLLNYGTNANLIKASKDLNIKVTNGAIGQEVGPCDGGVCTGIGPEARDLTKSVNIAVDGKVNAVSSKGSNESLVNIASLDKNMNVDKVKADGRVILLADSSVKGSKAFDIVNASSNSSVPNVEGAGISMIASGNIGSKNNALTFRQTQGSFGKVDNNLNHSSNAKYGVDMLAIKDINVKGMDSADGKKLDTNVCGIISREGSVNAEFSGDTYIREITAKNNVDLTTRGQNMYIENLGNVPTYPQDYYGKNGNINPEKVKVTALDLGTSWPDNPANSTIIIKNGTINGSGEGRPAHEQDLTLVADNAYAGGYYFNMGKNRGEVEDSDPLRFNPSSVTVDNRTNTITNSSDASKPVSIRAKAVRPDDVTAIGKEEDERNYYYGGSSQGNDDGYDGVKDDDGNYVDNPSTDDQGNENDDDNVVVPDDKKEQVDTDSDSDTDIDTDTDTDTDMDTDSDTDTDTDVDTDND